jgi:signal peptidase I
VAPRRPARRPGGTPTGWLAAAAGAWGLALVVNRSLRDVEGASMTPTLTEGDRLVVAPRLGLPRHGDVVVLRDPRDPERTTVKRVVALPGEHVALRRGRLVLDGVTHAEPYTTGPTPGSLDLVVPEDCVVVLGDNRGGSTDSRAYGPVPLGLVDAVVVALVHPRVRVGLREAPRALGAA